jgi:hypothetical protein
MEPAIAIYIGAPVSIGSEVSALYQLYGDLQKAGISVLLLVNFEVGGRQIDCVVITKRQATMLDFKNLNGPIKGGVNGPWMLRDYGGSERRYDGENPYQEVLTAKFALATALRDFHRATGIGVAPDKGQFVRLLNAAVCVFPSIAAGSSVTKGGFKCRVWSYAEALSEITTRQLNPRWSMEEWTRFAEHLHLENVSLEAAVSPDHRKAEKALTAYTQALVNGLSAEIFPNLPGPAISLPTDQHVLIIGPSGIGKTVHLRRHATSLAHGNRLVLFCSGRHYTGSLDRLLARSVAPFSKKTPAQLIEAAGKCGWGVDLVIDGMDGFAASREHDLIDGVASFALRYGARVIISSMGEVNLPPGIKSSTITIPALTNDQKLAVFSFHAGAGCVPPNGFLAAFETAHDIMVAAKSASFVPSGSSRADYYAAYVFESLPVECRTVAGALLRHLANRMHHDFVRSIEFTEFERESSGFLQEVGGSLEIADRVTKLPQVSASRGMFSFKHDLWQDYLAAEFLLSSTSDPESLCDELSKPINRRLAPHAIGRMRDPAIVGTAIESACDGELIADGFAGGLGQQSKAFLEKKYQHLWDDLIIDAGGLQVIPPAVEESPDRKRLIMGWPQISSRKTWSACERSVADWVSTRLHQPEIARKFIDLLESSSLALWGASEAAAHRTKVSTRRIFSDALHELFHFQGPSIPLTAFGMFRMWEQSRWMCESQGDPNLALRKQLLDRLPICPNESKAVVLSCLATILRHDECPAWDTVSRVFHLGWEQRMHPVGSQLLLMIQRHGYDLVQKAPELAEPIKKKLEAALGDNPFSNTFIFDALNALGAVPPPVSTDEALAELRGIIDSKSEYAVKIREAHDAWQIQFPDATSDGDPVANWAAGLVSKFFEDIFQGVYWEAYTSLSRLEKIRLMNLAAMQVGAGFSDSFVLRELVTFCDESSKDVFRSHAAEVRLDEPMQQEAVAIWCLAIIGCARLGLPMPAWRGGTDVASQAWRLIGELLYQEHIGEGSSREADELWLTLRSEAAKGAADVFLHLLSAEGTGWMNSKDQELTGWRRLLTHPTHIHVLMEHSLLQLDHLVSMSKWNMRDRRDPFIIEVLGTIGDQSTVALLRRFVSHPTLGSEAVAAIEKINGRRGNLGSNLNI